MKNTLIIDGENFKWKMKAVIAAHEKEILYHTYDFRGLFEKILQGINAQRKIFYFGRIKENPQTKEKSQKLIEEQRLLKTHLEKQGFEVILVGRVRGQFENGFLGKKILIFREKGVDVKIGVDMVSWACDKKVDEIILASSDSDLQPAIREVRERGVRCVYIGFESSQNKGLTYTTDRTILVRDSEILEHGEENRNENRPDCSEHSVKP